MNLPSSASLAEEGTHLRLRPYMIMNGLSEITNTCSALSQFSRLACCPAWLLNPDESDHLTAGRSCSIERTNWRPTTVCWVLKSQHYFSKALQDFLLATMQTSVLRHHKASNPRSKTSSRDANNNGVLLRTKRACCPSVH
jgi:hypothetical protein